MNHAYPAQISGAPSNAVGTKIASPPMPRWASIKREHVVLLFLGVLGANLAFVQHYGPDLWRDHRYAGTWIRAEGHVAFGGACDTAAFTVSFCSAKIQEISAQRPIAQEYKFFLLLSRPGGTPLNALKSQADPSVVTIAYPAVDKLSNRTVAFVLFMSLLLWPLYKATIMLVMGRFENGRAHKALLQNSGSRSRHDAVHENRTSDAGSTGQRRWFGRRSHEDSVRIPTSSSMVLPSAFFEALLPTRRKLLNKLFFGLLLLAFYPIYLRLLFGPDFVQVAVTTIRARARESSGITIQDLLMLWPVAVSLCLVYPSLKSLLTGNFRKPDRSVAIPETQREAGLDRRR